MSPTIEVWTRRANAVADALAVVAPGPVHRAMIAALAVEMTNDGKAGPDVMTQILALAANVPHDRGSSALTYVCDALDALEGRRAESPEPCQHDPVPAVVLDALAALARLYPHIVSHQSPPAIRSPRYTGASPWCPMCPDTVMPCLHDPAARDTARACFSPAEIGRHERLTRAQGSA
jgi:hypothetical protein